MGTGFHTAVVDYKTCIHCGCSIKKGTRYYYKQKPTPKHITNTVLYEDWCINCAKSYLGKIDTKATK